MIQFYWYFHQIISKNTTTLLTKMVGTGKFRDEEIAQMIVSEGAIEKLLKALNHPSEKSKKTIKVYKFIILGYIGIT